MPKQKTLTIPGLMPQAKASGTWINILSVRKKVSKDGHILGYEVAGESKTIHEAYIIPESEVDYSTLPTVTETASARTMSALTLVENATGWRKFSFVKNTLGGTSEGSAGDITTAVTNNLTGTLGGKRIAIDNLIQDQCGNRFFIVVVDRLTQEKTIYGRPYAPMELRSFSKRENADNTSCDVTFANDYHFQPLKYLGSVEAEEEEEVNDLNGEG